MEELKKQIAEQKTKKIQEKELKSQPQEGIVFSGYADHKAKMDKLGSKKPQQEEPEMPQYQPAEQPQIQHDEYEAVQVPNLLRLLRKISSLQ